jgi:beta-glucosidase-like glycosyl hydrolase
MTSLDSHLTLPVVDQPRDALEAIHICPFKDAKESGVDGIMVSHCLYRSLQTDGLPASLSRQIVDDCLRQDLGFEGVVFTDSLDMLAVVEAVPPERAALLAFEAGCDILLYTEHSERFVVAFDTLVEAAMKGSLSEARLRQALARRNNLMSDLRRRAARADAATFNEAEYGRRLDAVRANSLRISAGQGSLPLSSRKISLVSTSPTAAEKLRKHVPNISLLPAPEKLPGSVLILWLMEPLVLRQSLNALRSMVTRAQTSVLVTTYEALAEQLGAADVRIVTDDTSPHTEDSIIRSLFESRSGPT